MCFTNLLVVSGAVVGFGADLAAACTFRGPSSMFSSSSSSSSSVSQSLLFRDAAESENDDGEAVSSLLSVNAEIEFKFDLTGFQYSVENDLLWFD